MSIFSSFLMMTTNLTLNLHGLPMVGQERKFRKIMTINWVVLTANVLPTIPFLSF